MRSATRVSAWVGAAAVWLAATPAALAQCAMCKSGLLNSPEGQLMARGFNRGILFMLAAPLVIVGTIVLLLLRARWQSRGSRLEDLGRPSRALRAEERLPSGAL
jgi:hypothetical protein